MHKRIIGRLFVTDDNIEIGILSWIFEWVGGSVGEVGEVVLDAEQIAGAFPDFPFELVADEVGIHEAFFKVKLIGLRELVPVIDAFFLFILLCFFGFFICFFFASR